MIPFKTGLPVRKKGYRSPEEVEKSEKEIRSFFKNEKDEKTFTELLGMAKRKGWGKTSLWRYLERMIKERKLIKEGKGKGATYRCNLVELMQLDHFAYLDKIRKFCSKKGLSLFCDQGSVSCSILGIPSEGLTDYEQLVAQAIVEKLSSSWLLLYGLRGIISQRLHTKRRVIDVYNMLSLYRHEFDEVLEHILEHPKMRAGKIKEFFEYLKKGLISWTRKQEIPCSFLSLDSLTANYDLEKIEDNDTHLRYPPLEFKDDNIKLYPEEIVALTITGHIMDSKEFSQRVENWLKYYLRILFRSASRYNLSKAQEISEAILEIFKTMSLRGLHLHPASTPPPVLKKEEKERLLNWDLLLNRYGEENTKFIVNLAQEATLRYAAKKDEIDVHHWINKETGSYLEKKGLVDSYVKEKF